MSNDAILALADGAVFRGESCGFNGCAVGEAVFNTAMTGYQEILTDPSYHRQIVALTAPHIGNTGINPHDDESPRIFAARTRRQRNGATAFQLARENVPSRISARAKNAPPSAILIRANSPEFCAIKARSAHA